MTGKNAVSYNDPYLGPVRCDEVHHAPGKNGQLAFDSISCTSTTGAVLGTGAALGPVTGGQDWTLPYGWNSDFPGAQYTPNATIHFSDDGMSYTATIAYPGATS
jgi:hypothetical protein